MYIYILKFAYWSIIDLQCCVSFRCIAKEFSFIYMFYSLSDYFPLIKDIFPLIRFIVQAYWKVVERVIKQHISTYTPFCFFNQMFVDVMANYSPSLFLLHLVRIPRWYFFSQVNVTVDLTYAEGMCAIPGVAHKSLLHKVSLPLAWVRQAKQTSMLQGKEPQDERSLHFWITSWWSWIFILHEARAADDFHWIAGFCTC